MAERVDVAIIGAGIAGASVAYYLAREGVRNVLVLERTAVAAGASGRASGLVSFVTAHYPGLADILKASADFYDAWVREIGGAPALTRVGSIVLATDAERDGLETGVRTMQQAGHPVRVVERDELVTLVPDWDLGGVDVAAYSPTSGFIDPPMVTTALMNRARALGVRVYHGAEVTAIEMRGGRVAGVTSPRGDVAAPVVVMAAGAWSAALAGLVGVELPLWPVRHQVVHMQPPAELRWPIHNGTDTQNCVYFRSEPGGLVLAANSGPDDYPDEPACDPEQFDPTAGAWYQRWVAARLARRIPAMRTATIVGGHAGVYAEGPDGLPLLGPVPGVEGLYCICDTAGSGMTSSPGLGRALAEVIVRGATFTDLRPFHPARFAGGDAGLAPRRHDITGRRSSWEMPDNAFDMDRMTSV